MHKLNNEILKKRIIEKFGDIFILDKLDYKNNKTKVIITCSVHGDFEVLPSNFLSQSKGCPKCVIEKRSNKQMLSLEEVVKRANEIHHNKYSYKESVFKGVNNEMTITCPIHGNFNQIVSHHLNGHGCPKCANNDKKTTEDFKKEFIEKFGNNFNLDYVEYKGNKAEVKIICPKHGEFKATPNFLLSHSSYACPECAKESRGFNRRKPFSQFLKEARAIHGDKYMYYEDTYTTTHNKMKMKCSICGTEFEQTPNKHVGKEHNGCPNCARKLVGLKCRKTYEKFLEQANLIHGDKYSYHDDYINAHTKMRMTCPIHGDFYQRPYDHIFGKKGCPKCSESHLEREVRLFLEENNIKYEYEKRFDWLGLMSLDFYLPEYNIAIECQGGQHFGIEGRIRGCKDIMKRDAIKNELVNKNGIRLLYYCNPHEKKLAYKDGVPKIYNDENVLTDVKSLIEYLVI